MWKAQVRRKIKLDVIIAVSAWSALDYVDIGNREVLLFSAVTETEIGSLLARLRLFKVRRQIKLSIKEVHVLLLVSVRIHLFLQDLDKKAYSLLELLVCIRVPVHFNWHWFYAHASWDTLYNRCQELLV